MLGLPQSWEVEDVKLSLSALRVEIRIKYSGKVLTCPECGLPGSAHDLSPEQTWRHLDSMQFETIIAARIPRCRCKKCGVKTLLAPWAERHSRFTLMFESFALAVLQHSANISSASKLLRLNWHALNEIMNRAVERGLSRRAPEVVAAIGLDEKSFRSGHRYITTMNDIAGGRVLDVVEDRTTAATETLLESLTATQREGVKAITMDMWKPFQIAVEKHVAKADIVHDRFHISKYLNNAVDAVRRHESRCLIKDGNKCLVGSKFVWLRNPENMTTRQKRQFDKLQNMELNTGIAWSIKNIFRSFWNSTSELTAREFFDSWCEIVDLSELTPIIKVKNLLVRHIDNIMNYFKHRVSNAVSEGLNSKIQMIKAAARGFHSFISYRVRILFFCGKLDMSIKSAS